jgi:multidrug resistance protein
MPPSTSGLPEAARQPPPRASNASLLGLSRPMALILFTVFLDLLGIGLIFPIGPFYASAFGASAFDVGLLFTLFSVAQFLTIPILGALSDRYGRRPVLLIGIAGEVVGYLLFGAATSLTMLYLSRLVAGASSGNIGAAQAYIADISTPRERTRSFGLLGAAVSVGFLFGPAMGGFLGQYDLRLPAFAAAALVVVNWISVLVWLPESLPAERRSTSSLATGLNPFGVLVTLLRRPLMRGPLAATFFCNFAFSGYLASFALFTSAHFGWGPQQVAVVLVIQSMLSIVIQTFGVRRLSESLPDTTILLAGIGLNLVGFLVIALAPDPLFLYVLSAPLQATGSALWRPALSSLITKLVSGREQGLANGGAQAASALATIVGPMGAGILFEDVGTMSPFLAGAALFALAAATIVVAVRLQPGLRRPPRDLPSAGSQPLRS